MAIPASSSLVDLRELHLETARALILQSEEQLESTNPAESLQTLQGLIDALCELSLRDPLTGLANRRHFRTVLEREVDRVNRSGEGALLLMLDIDHFKQVNDTYGHMAGDAVLQSIADTLQKCVRPMDTLARFGGEEFAVVLPACQARYGEVVAERIRLAVESTPVRISPHIELNITVSVGGAFTQQWGRSTPLIWTDRADLQLYKAKANGRNCISIEDQPDSTVTADEKSLLFAHLGSNYSATEPALQDSSRLTLES